MKTLRIATDGTGCPRLESLPLPFLSPGPTATAADKESAPAPTTLAAVDAMRTTAVTAGWQGDLTGTSRLYLLISGSLRVMVPEMQARVTAGDVLFLDLDADTELPARLRAETDVQMIEVSVHDTWSPVGTVPPELEEARRGVRSEGRVVHLRSEGGAAHLVDLPELFAGAAEQSIQALSFVCLSPGMTSDWHTEPGVSLLVVLAGGFEVEVGGSGGVGGRLTLRAGDVCLVEDFDGQGHKSSSDGETRFAVLSLPRDHRYGVSA